MFEIKKTAVFEEDQFLSSLFSFFYLHGIEMLVYSLTLNKDVFELCLVQLVNCWKMRKDEYQEFFYLKNNFFRLFTRTGLNDIFQLKAQSRIFTKSLFSLKAETLALFTTKKIEVSSANSLTL